MRLAECLNHASVKTLRDIAVYQKLECAMYSKLDLMENILLNMRSNHQLEHLISAWCEYWGESFRRLALHSRTKFSKEEVRGLLRDTDQNALHKALSQGWLYANSIAEKRLVYVIPDEIRRAIQTHFRSQWMAERICRDDEPLLQYDEQMAMVQDMDTLLNYVANHDVRLTIGGAMYKKNVQQLMELFEVAEDLALPEWRFGYGRRVYDYPDRLALMYDFGFDHDMFIETPECQLQISQSAVDEWRATPRKVQLQRMYHYYLRIYRRPIPRLREVIETIRMVADEWVSSQSVFQICQCHIESFYYDTEWDVWEKRILRMLQHLGIIRTGFDGDEKEPVWFQITKLGQELLTQDEAHLPDEQEYRQASLIVQPNFEIVVTAQDSALEAQIAQFADLKSGGAMRIYRVLEKTVTRGLNAGHDFAKWRVLLAERGMGPVPGNVDRMFDEWAKGIPTTGTLTS